MQQESRYFWVKGQGARKTWRRRKEKVWQLFQSCKIELQINLPTAVLIHHNGRFSLGRNCWGKYRGEIDLKWKSMLRWLCANSSSNNLVKSLEIPFPFCLSSGVSVRGWNNGNSSNFLKFNLEVRSCQNASAYWWPD